MRAWLLVAAMALGLSACPDPAPDPATPPDAEAPASEAKPSTPPPATPDAQSSAGGAGGAGASPKPRPDEPPPLEDPVAVPEGRVDLRPPRVIQAKAPRTEDGLPLVIEPPRPPSGAVGFQVAYDPKLDDPATRFGDCLSLLVACRQNTQGPVLPCARALPQCGADGVEEGAKCCPPACLMPLIDKLSAGVDELEALEATVLQGDCVDGLAKARERGAKALEAMNEGGED